MITSTINCKPLMLSGGWIGCHPGEGDTEERVKQASRRNDASRDGLSFGYAESITTGATRINAIWPKSVTGFFVKNCKVVPKRESVSQKLCTLGHHAKRRS